MAEIVVSAVITVLFERLLSGDLLKLAQSEGVNSQLQKLKKDLPLIQAVLADASQKHIKDTAVQLWVTELQNLAYDIDDVLDDLATEAIRRNLNQEARASSSNVTGKVLKLLPNCCTTFTPRNFIYGRQMSSKLDEVSTRLDDLVDRRSRLGLIVNSEKSNKREKRQEETSLVDELEIMGREGDKLALVEKLLGNEESVKNVSIVSIVGMGGIGKTTLAKLLYNDEKVKAHFKEVRAWVCVSEELDVFNISKAIFQAVTGENKDFANLDLLHVALKEKLSKKKFLIVLDDVWNEDPTKWEILQSPLLDGAPGSRVIVTTRSTNVASVMGSKELYGLDVLSNKDALSLFALHSVGEKNFDNHPAFKFFAESIVKKCGELPLALKTLGGTLKGNTKVDKWEEMLKSEIWEINDGSEILPALKLSYYHLPPHLKQLFAYCSIIPKDYLFDKNKLVLLWVAEGFLSHSKGSRSMESLGHQYFEDLTSRSFFQHSTEDGKSGYTMHDLLNDLATSVSAGFSFRSDVGMDVSHTNASFEKLRHFSLIGLRSASCTKLKEVERAKRLRTFLLMSVPYRVELLDNVLVKLLPKLPFLRVLSVMELSSSHDQYRTQMIRKVPDSIGSLKHLRYLNFSFTGITCLPEQVSDLINLQSLLVHNCHELSSLPKSFGKLINLRHLDIGDTPKLKKMPLGIAGCKSLQTLTKVIVNRPNRFKISDLEGLSDLQGRLFITGLEKVRDPIQATNANLDQKKDLDDLEMKWSDEFDDSRDDRIEYEVLDKLKPSPKLIKLKILNNMGTRFPSWVSDPLFDQLTELMLRGCRSTHLPTLGHLQSLRKLVVEEMREVKSVGFELLAPTNSFPGVAFPSLEVLSFFDMEGWEKWSVINSGGHHGSFPCLRKISIRRCPKLGEVSIGLIPSLQVLYIEECPEAVVRSMVGLSSSLVKLLVWKVEGLTQVLHGEDLMHLGALERLKIQFCDEVRYLWERDSEACKSLVSLKKLKVENCKKLVSSAAEKEVSSGVSMKSLKQVTFEGCGALESYDCPNTVESLVIKNCDSVTSLSLSTVGDCDNIQPISRLTSLTIWDCKNLKSIPHEHLHSLTALEEMWITDCPSMDNSFPCGVWPPNLRQLTIGGGLNKRMSEWGVQNFPTSLVDLTLYGRNSGVVSFAVADDVTTPSSSSSSSSFLLPPSLVFLWLIGFEEVESFAEVLQHLPCLTSLLIQNCPKIRDIKTTSDPSSKLRIIVD